MPLSRLCLATAVLSTTVAHADPATAPVAVFDKVTLENRGDAVYARRGALVARLASGQFSAAPAIDAKAQKVSFATLDFCDRPSASVAMTFAQITARLDNVAAYGLHKQKKYAESKAAFAKVLALDPTFRIAAVNLASAQQLLGEKDDAVKTLAPWLASEPIAMYATIAGDRELAPLLAQPALAPLKAKVPGTATVAPNSFTSGVAFSSEKNLLAVQRSECSWGADGPDACAIAIEIFDPTRGTLVTSIPLSNFDASNRAVLVARAAGAQATLRDLGFKTEAVVTGKDTTTAADRESVKHRFSFGALKVGVAGQDGTANVLRGDTVLAHGATLDRLQAAAWSPKAKAFILSSERPGHEGCEGTNPTLVTVVPATLP